jgi:regulatory protein YycI of two-component signal transduction system YycFG
MMIEITRMVFGIVFIVLGVSLVVLQVYWTLQARNRAKKERRRQVEIVYKQCVRIYNELPEAPKPRYSKFFIHSSQIEEFHKKIEKHRAQGNLETLLKYKREYIRYRDSLKQ